MNCSCPMGFAGVHSLGSRCEDLYAQRDALPPPEPLPPWRPEPEPRDGNPVPEGSS